MSSFLSPFLYNSINLQVFLLSFRPSESSQTRCSTWYWKHKNHKKYFFVLSWTNERENISRFFAVLDGNYSRSLKTLEKKFKIEFGMFKVQFKFLVQLQAVAINFYLTSWQIMVFLKIQQLVTLSVSLKDSKV